MKSLYKYISMFFVGMAVLSSCADENEIVTVEKNEPERTVVRLSFQQQADKEVINSRATDVENKLYDLHFYVFNAEGNLTGYKKIEKEDGTVPSPGPKEVEIQAMTGESYIYAVANINKSTSYYLNDNDKQLLNVTDVAASELTRAALLDIEFERQFGIEGSELFSPNPAGDIFVMSGYLNDGNSVTIAKDGAITGNDNVIKLYRILAKNTLTITSNVTNGQFTPKYYRLCNVPIGGMLIPNSNISDVEQYTEDNETDADVESSFRWNFNGATEISFYYPENLRKAKSGGSIAGWKDREDNSWANDRKTFTNADDDAAYIEIHGDYTANSGKVTANVSYTIHFGNFSTNGGSIDDFNVIRNHAYTYKITVNGVEDIKVEAEKSENNPYAEGLIIEADGGIAYDVDAHYEARVMAFTKSSIQALKNANDDHPGYIVNIKTPFGETNQTVYVKDDGVYNISGDKKCSIEDVSAIFNGDTDYQWIKFVRNTTNNRMANNQDISKYPCKYPGDTSKDCLNVFELLAELYDEDTYDNDETIYYTCFIDENYYASKSWPEYVNKAPRIMLIANDLNVSTDGKSLYAKVAYSISQRSISTFYIEEEDKVAFGTEIIDEEAEYGKRLDRNNVGEIKSPDDWKARTSAVATNNKGKWYESNVNYVENSQPLYTTVAKACMSRNRDLDGDGNIEGEEVKWYLAAVEQYRALVYGQGSLHDGDSYLISEEELGSITKNNGSNLARARFHYFSASSGTNFIFWPEEGLSTSANTRGASGAYDYGDAELVRCIRTLESNDEGLSDPASFYTYDSSTRTFRLDGIVATRQSQNVPLGVHDELSYENGNGLYSSFVVASKDLSGTYSADDVTRNSNDPCSNYKEGDYSWRTPNQKEFSLMLSEGIATNGNYAIRTDFSGATWKSTNGFWSNNGRINVDTNGSTGLKIRCVRDNI